MAAIGVHFGYTCACVAVFKVNIDDVFIICSNTLFITIFKPVFV